MNGEHRQSVMTGVRGGAVGTSAASALSSRTVMAVMIVALLWRCVYLLRLRATPLADLLETDSRIYWEWAGQLLYSGWIGTHQFFMAPLYPYTLTVVRLGTGDSIAAIQALQSLMSVGTIGLLTALAVKLHGRRWGLVLGIMLAGYGPWMFMDAQVLMEPLLLLLQVLLLSLVFQLARQATMVRVATLGVVVGLMSLGRATNLFLILPIALELYRTDGRGWARPTVVMVAAALCMAVPTAVRSLAIGRECIPYTYGLGYNFYVGNGAGATGGFVNLPQVATNPPDNSFEGGALGDGRHVLLARFGFLPSPRRSSDLWLSLAVADITSDPGRWLRVVARKSLLLLNGQESAQVQSPDAYAAMAGPIGWPGVGGFGVIGLLGIVGMTLGLSRAGPFRMLATVWIVLAAGTVVFFVTDRYRIHLVPSMLLLSPLGIQHLHGVLASRQWARGGAMVLGVLVAMTIVWWPIVGSSQAKRNFDVAATIASALLQANRSIEAAQQLEKAIAIDRQHQLPGANTSTGRSARANVYSLHAMLAMEQGEWRRAIVDLERARTLEPSSETHLRYLMIALAANGRSDEAIALINRDTAIAAGLRDELVVRIEGSEKQERYVAMEGYLRALNAIHPGWEPGTVALVRFLIDRNRTVEARSVLDAAHERGLRTEVYRAHLAAALKREGALREAARLVDAIPDELRVHDPVVSATIRAYELMPR